MSPSMKIAPKCGQVTGSLPQVMATLRNTVVSLLRATGEINIAKALRHYAARPDEALALIGLPS